MYSLKHTIKNKKSFITVNPMLNFRRRENNDLNIIFFARFANSIMSHGKIYTFVFYLLLILIASYKIICHRWICFVAQTITATVTVFNVLSILTSV